MLGRSGSGAGEVGGGEASVANRPVVFAQAPWRGAGHQGIPMATAPTTGQAHQATPAGGERGARVTRSAGRLARAVLRLARSALRSAWAARPRGRVRLIDVLRVLGLARRAVPSAVVGPKAYPQWWQRILALIALVALVVVIGFVLAAAVGIMVVVAGFLLENAIS